ncbi:anaphase-promoting complex subunit 4-like isoform X1 [Syzygium oleosum]|uniref:anaphase-promoting complex subunit 4-like isoform X1 n=1 Tax=Syzygium oleosum TaxID=219896 RepID=UPI0024B93BC8|nr:anaphase-promoting complex subunit 4-like isoform X1 [Syzygium oleosum]
MVARRTPRKVGGASSLRLARGCGQPLPNGKLLRSLKSHMAAVVCLNWEEDAQVNRNASGNSLTFEDRTTQFFPPAPRVRMPGLVPRDVGLTDDVQNSFVELSNSSKQCFHILYGGDKDGVLCFSIIGVFPIGNIVSVLSVQIKYLAVRSIKFSRCVLSLFLLLIQQFFLINGFDGRLAVNQYCLESNGLVK